MRVVFLVLQNTSLLDIAGASQVFHEARYFGMDIDMEYCSYIEKIKSSCDLPLGHLKNFNEVKGLGHGDFLFITSAQTSFVLNLNPNKALLQWINDAHQNRTTICGICNGVFILGRTGLLDGRNCTTHWKYNAELQRRFPRALVTDNHIYIYDKSIYTSAGASSAIDVALHIISKIKDESFAYKISRELVVYNRRAGNHSQQSLYAEYRNHMHIGIHNVQNWLHQNLNKENNLPFLASKACMSIRNFTRVFKKETGITVNDYITLLRKEKIKELQKLPDINRIKIASMVGLKSERHLARIMDD